MSNPHCSLHGAPLSGHLGGLHFLTLLKLCDFSEPMYGRRHNALRSIFKLNSPASFFLPVAVTLEPCVGVELKPWISKGSQAAPDHQQNRSRPWVYSNKPVLFLSLGNLGIVESCSLTKSILMEEPLNFCLENPFLGDEFKLLVSVLLVDFNFFHFSLSSLHR